MTDVTRILNAIEQGDAKGADELQPVVYEELPLLAAQKLSHEPPGQTLQATELVHDTYLRLVGTDGQSWYNRGHFFRHLQRQCDEFLLRTHGVRKPTSWDTTISGVDSGDTSRKAFMKQSYQEHK